MPQSLLQRFDQQLNQLLLQAGGVANAPLVVAFSGGADSTALACLLAQLGYSFRLIHVHHGLAEQADAWALHCQKMAECLAVPIDVLRVRLDKPTLRDKGLEAAARVVRYQAIAESTNKDELLLTAHHADDQLETVLYRLERGVGVTTLSGMAAYNSLAVASGSAERSLLLLRPLLGFSKAELLAFLAAEGVAWVEDPSNTSRQVRRGFYRQEVMPALSQGVVAELTELSENSAQITGALSSRLDSWLAERALAENGLQMLVSDYQQLYWLALAWRTWLQKRGVGLPKARLSELLRQSQSGRAQGQNPSFVDKKAGYSLWLKKHQLWLKRY